MKSKNKIHHWLMRLGLLTGLFLWACTGGPSGGGIGEVGDVGGVGPVGGGFAEGPVDIPAPTVTSSDAPEDFLALVGTCKSSADGTSVHCEKGPIPPEQEKPGPITMLYEVFPRGYFNRFEYHSLRDLLIRPAYALESRRYLVDFEPDGSYQLDFPAQVGEFVKICQYNHEQFNCLDQPFIMRVPRPGEYFGGPSLPIRKVVPVGGKSWVVSLLEKAGGMLSSLVMGTAHAETGGGDAGPVIMGPSEIIYELYVGSEEETAPECNTTFEPDTRSMTTHLRYLAPDGVERLYGPQIHPCFQVYDMASLVDPAGKNYLAVACDKSVIIVDPEIESTEWNAAKVAQLHFPADVRALFPMTGYRNGLVALASSSTHTKKQSLSSFLFTVDAKGSSRFSIGCVGDATKTGALEDKPYMNHWDRKDNALVLASRAGFLTDATPFKILLGAFDGDGDLMGPLTEVYESAHPLIPQILKVEPNAIVGKPPVVYLALLDPTLKRLMVVKQDLSLGSTALVYDDDLSAIGFSGYTPTAPAFMDYGTIAAVGVANRYLAIMDYGSEVTQVVIGSLSTLFDSVSPYATKTVGEIMPKYIQLLTVGGPTPKVFYYGEGGAGQEL